MMEAVDVGTVTDGRGGGGGGGGDGDPREGDDIIDELRVGFIIALPLISGAEDDAECGEMLLLLLLLELLLLLALLLVVALPPMLPMDPMLPKHPIPPK